MGTHSHLDKSLCDPGSQLDRPQALSKDGCKGVSMFYTMHPLPHIPLETHLMGPRSVSPIPACPAVRHPLCWRGRDLGAFATYLTPIVNMLRRGFPCTQPTSIRRPARDRTASGWAPVSPVPQLCLQQLPEGPGPLGTQILGLSSDLRSLAAGLEREDGLGCTEPWSSLWNWEMEA